MQLSHHRAGSGAPLVLIHGIGSQWQMWEPVLDRLTGVREVIAIDLPGFGASPMPPAGTPAGPQSLVSLVIESLNEMGVRAPHVAGNSLGGLIALELARRGQVRSATALSPAGFANRPESWQAHVSLALGVRTARLIAPHADRLMGPAAGRTAALNLFLAHPSRISPSQAAHALRALAGAAWFDATLPTIAHRSFRNGAGIEVPVTIAWGDKDRVLPPRQARRASWAVPSARMVTLYDCGHVPTYDDPEQVAQIMLEGSAT